MTQSQTQTTTTSQGHLLLMKKAKPIEKFRKDYLRPAYSIKRTELLFKLDGQETIVNANLHVYRTTEGAAGDLRLDGENIELISLGVENVKLQEDKGDYYYGDENDPHALFIKEAKLPMRKPGETFVVTTSVRNWPNRNSQLMGLYKSGGLLCTQCEAEGFRRITFYLDRPDVMSVFHVRLEADKKAFPVLLSNGDKTAHGDLDGGKHFAEFDDPFPKPAHLFAVVAGDLRKITGYHDTLAAPNAPSRKVEINVFSEPQDSAKLEWALKSVQRAMAWDEKRFGRIYDLNTFNVVCVGDFNFGAMENKGLNIFNAAAVLASKETATDADHERIMGIVGHEYFHNWSGDRVNLRDWFQLTLKEGLTVFRDQEFSRDLGSAAKKRIEDVMELRSRQFEEDAGPMSHPIRPESYISMDNFYTSTVYEKGAEVIRMYQTLLGKETFRKALDLYFATHDGQAVTCDDFRAAMAKGSGRDLTQFENWYTQKGTPTLEVTKSIYDPESQTFTIAFKQILPPHAVQTGHTAAPYHIPVRFGLIGKTSRRDIITEQVLELTNWEQEFQIKDVKEDAVPSVLRDFSAPVRLTPFLSEQDLGFLMAYDSDDFNKWEAGQMLMTHLILSRAQKVVKGEMTVEAMEPLPKILIQAFEEGLKKGLSGSTEQDLSSITYSLLLPGVNALQNDMKPADPVVLHQVREMTRRQLQEATRGLLKEVYAEMSRRCSEEKEYRITMDAVGCRRLRNFALSMLTAVSPKETAEAGHLAYEHVKNAKNMNDYQAGLLVLTNLDCKERILAFKEFYDRAKNDSLVLDKWFRLQAVSTLPNTLEHVKLLLKHPDYEGSENPNRLRALVGAFAGGNEPQFHRADGQGYEFVADQVLLWDEFNHMIAARLATTLIGYQKYSEVRQRQMIKALERIASSTTISSHLQEVVGLALKK